MLLRIYSLTRSADIHTDNNAVSDKTGKPVLGLQRVFRSIWEFNI